MQEQLRTVGAYLNGFVTTNARDDEATALQSRLQAEVAPLRTLNTRFAAWIARLGAEQLIAASPAAADHAWPLRKAERAAVHQMTEAEEGLAAELNLTGGSAWNRLHGDVTSRLTADVQGERLPITVVRNLAMSTDSSVRKAAYEAELEAWASVSVPLAAAMNGIKGEGGVLNRRRGWSDSLEPALFTNAVDRTALDAMHAAVVASFPDFRDYLRAKARLLGHREGAGLPWWDLFAPAGDPSSASVTWDEASDAVLDAFATYSPTLASLARRAFDERWVDAEAHDGKRGGAFCMPVRGDESRVLMNFGGTFDSVSTLAHELGHAYHNTNLADRTPMQRQTPMALAETASIFCETILVQAGLRAAVGDPGRELAVLDTDLTGATQVVVDIHSRFLFEREVFDRRAMRAMSVQELNDAMTDAQLATYGTGSIATRFTRTCGRSSRTTTPPPSTTGRTPSACSSASGCTPATRRIPSASASGTTTCCRPRDWRTPPSWRADSASTSGTRASGRTASRSCGSGSSGSRRSCAGSTQRTPAGSVVSLMGSLIKKRRKRMRKKKHKKMLKRTRWQRRAGK